MLAPLIIESLLASLLLLFVGWIIDLVHASTHGGPSSLNLERAIGWHPISRSAKPLPSEEPDARWRARPVGRHRPLGRRLWHPLSIGRLRPHKPELRRSLS